MKTIQLVMFAVLLMAAGCKIGNDKATLSSHEWQLKEMVVNGTSVAAPQQMPEIFFTDSTTVYGSTGCNRFFGTYTIDDKGGMTVQPGGSTMMFCPDMQFEDQYLKALTEITAYTVTPEELKATSVDQMITLLYIPKDTTKLIGVADDTHGCNAAAGFTWSELRQTCIRLFETGVRVNSVADTMATSSAFIIFSVDSAKVELFIPNNDLHPVLDRKQLPDGSSAWNVEDDTTMNVRMVDGRWVIEQRGDILYSEDKK